MTIDAANNGFFENPYFDREEFACKCGCGYSTVDARLLEMLTIVRGTLIKPVYITSGARCLTHNAKVGGAAPQLGMDHQPVSGTGSQHLWGLAADITVEDTPPHEVQNLLTQCMEGWGGIGSYKTFTHIDVRPKMARWKGND